MSSIAAWIAAGAAVAGVGAAVYGANKQAQANKDATAANQASQAEQNQSAWNAYLAGKGVAPTTPVAAGVYPTAGNYNAVNTRLPLWATVNQTVGPNGNVSLTTTSTPVRQPNGFKDGKVTYSEVQGPLQNSSASTNANTTSNQATGVSGMQRLNNFMDPLNIIAGKNKSPLDPFGLFG